MSKYGTKYRNDATSFAWIWAYIIICQYLYFIFFVQCYVKSSRKQTKIKVYRETTNTSKRVSRRDPQYITTLTSEDRESFREELKISIDGKKKM